MTKGLLSDVSICKSQKFVEVVDATMTEGVLPDFPMSKKALQVLVTIKHSLIIHR